MTPVGEPYSVASLLPYPKDGGSPSLAALSSERLKLHLVLITFYEEGSVLGI